MELSKKKSGKAQENEDEILDANIIGTK